MSGSTRDSIVHESGNTLEVLHGVLHGMYFAEKVPVGRGEAVEYENWI
jgi:hypothetical protein